MDNQKLYEFPPMLGPPDEWPVGSLEWAERISNRLQIQTCSVNRETSYFLKSTVAAILEASPHPWIIWPKPPFGTPDDYCKAVTGHSWAALLTLVAEYTDDAHRDLTIAAMQSELAKAQVEYRGQGTRTDLLPYDVRQLRNEGYGNHSEYLLRRVARQDKETGSDFLLRYERGEYRSVRAAAIAAGIVKIKPPLEQLRSWWAKASNQERQTFLDEIQSCEN